METTLNIKIELALHPSEINNNTLDLIKHKFESNLFKTYFIKTVSKIVSISGGKILNNGYVQYNIIVSCIVLNPEISHVYKLEITNINKMGALHKNDLVTVFIPLQYYNNITPVIDTRYNIEIIGKRIEDSIVCVGKFI